MSHIVAKMPDIEIISNNNTQYFVDSEITKSAIAAEFLFSKYGKYGEIYLYKDIDFYTSEQVFFTKRIYSKEVFKYKLFTIKNDTILFDHDYCEHLNELGANTVAISEINLSLLDFISNNGYFLDKNTAPNKLKKLLPFI